MQQNVTKNVKFSIEFKKIVNYLIDNNIIENMIGKKSVYIYHKKLRDLIDDQEIARKWFTYYNIFHF